MKHRSKTSVLRYAAGFAAFMSVWLVGAALGITPSIAETLLIVVAIGAMEIAEALIDRLRRPVSVAQVAGANGPTIRVTGSVDPGAAAAIKRILDEDRRQRGGLT